MAEMRVKSRVKITRASIAKELGISRARLYDYQSGKGRPRLALLKRLRDLEIEHGIGEKSDPEKMRDEGKDESGTVQILPSSQLFSTCRHLTSRLTAEEQDALASLLLFEAAMRRMGCPAQPPRQPAFRPPSKRRSKQDRSRFARLVAVALARKNMTIGDLARAIGHARPSVSLAINHSINSGVRAKIADFLKLS